MKRQNKALRIGVLLGWGLMSSALQASTTQQPTVESPEDMASSGREVKAKPTEKERAPLSQKDTIQFAFFEPESDKALIRGIERVQRDGAAIVKQTQYLNRNGDVTQTEDSRYEADTLVLDYYRFEDLASGEKAEVRVANGKAAVSYRASKDDKIASDVISWTATSLSGKAIPELLGNSWGKLQQGESIAFDLYIPFRMETIGFRARKVEVRKNKLATAKNSVVIRVEPSNIIIRQFAPSIEFTYDIPAKGEPQLVLYRGPSTVTIEGERNKKVDMRFGSKPFD